MAAFTAVSVYYKEDIYDLSAGSRLFLSLYLAPVEAGISVRESKRLEYTGYFSNAFCRSITSHAVYE